MTATIDQAQLRKDVATGTRLLVFADILDYSGHLSARIDEDHLLILPRDMSRAGVTAEGLVVVDMRGELVEGDVPPPAEVAIHTGVYRSRPDVQAVCHGHPTLSTSFTMTDQAMLPMRHFAFKHPNGIPVHPDVTHIYTDEQGDAVAATLGSEDACMLRSHGTVITGSSVQQVFMDCLDLEENCRTLLNARQAGGELKPLTEQEVEDLRASYGKTSHRQGKVWNHYVTMARQAGLL